MTIERRRLRPEFSAPLASVGTFKLGFPNVWMLHRQTRRMLNGSADVIAAAPHLSRARDERMPARNKDSTRDPPTGMPFGMIRETDSDRLAG